MAVNGRLPRSDLARIPGGLLRKDAAAAWIALCAEARRRDLPEPRPLGPDSSYRPRHRQDHFWELWRSGRGNPAAEPGTSNHGWGVAVDVAPDGIRTMRILGPRFGFTNEEGARVDEDWHWSNPAGPAARFPVFETDPLLADERWHVRELERLRRLRRPTREQRAARRRHWRWLRDRRRALYRAAHGKVKGTPGGWGVRNRRARFRVIYRITNT